jgi:transcriptional regulator with XRE-family HTH domain
MPAKKSSPTADHLDRAIADSGKTLRDICSEIGLPRTNALSMMRRGTCKVPLDRIQALAEACGVPPAPFLRIAMEEYHPEVWKTLQQVFGSVLTQNEERWLAILRAHSKRTPVELDTDLWLEVYLHLDGVLSRRRRRS